MTLSESQRAHLEVALRETNFLGEHLTGGRFEDLGSIHDRIDRVLKEKDEPPGLDDVYERIEAFNDEFFPGWRNVRSNDLRLTTNAMAGEAGEGMQAALAVLVAEGALNGQVGKLCDLVKHLYGGGTKDKGATYVDVAEEGVDVLFYLVLLFGALGMDRKAFVAFIEEKLAKVRRRMEERGGHGRTA